MRVNGITTCDLGLTGWQQAGNGGLWCGLCDHGLWSGTIAKHLPLMQLNALPSRRQRIRHHRSQAEDQTTTETCRYRLPKVIWFCASSRDFLATGRIQQLCNVFVVLTLVCWYARMWYSTHGQAIMVSCLCICDPLRESVSWSFGASGRCSSGKVLWLADQVLVIMKASPIMPASCRCRTTAKLTSRGKISDCCSKRTWNSRQLLQQSWQPPVARMSAPAAAQS